MNFLQYLAQGLLDLVCIPPNHSWQLLVCPVIVVKSFGEEAVNRRSRGKTSKKKERVSKPSNRNEGEI